MFLFQELNYNFSPSVINISEILLELAKFFITFFWLLISSDTYPLETGRESKSIL